MKHIVKVNNIQEAKDNPIRPIVALDDSGVLFVEGLIAEFVDLGLSVKWAKYNIGVNPNKLTGASDWYGNYYAWGELAGKTEYNWTNYKYANDASDKLTKYCNNSNYGNDGFTDNLTQLVPEDDVATVTNSAWRMPTKAELEELKTLPRQWVTNYNGVSGLNGIVFTGSNKNTLFIPAAGFVIGSDILNVDSFCDIWSSSLDSTRPSRAHILHVASDSIIVTGANRFYGYCVRPVC